MANRNSDVIVIGGGASGLVAAIAAGQHGVDVTIVEKNMRVGKKILTTGNGRCNLSNTIIGKPEGMAQYNHPAFVQPVLSRFDCASIRLFFYELGLLTVADKNGWVFPRSRTANTVLDVLTKEIDRLPITTYTGQEIVNIRLTDEGYRVETSGSSFASKTLVLACGVVPLLKSFSTLAVVRPEPVLGPLRTDVDSLRGLDGIRTVCRIYLADSREMVSYEDGELLFRDFGVSGIAIFNLSRFAQPGQSLYIDFFPDLDQEELEAQLLYRFEKNNDLSASDLLCGMLHSKIIQAVLRKSKIKPNDSLDPELLKQLGSNLKRFRLIISASTLSDQAQATRGGLVTETIDPDTLGMLEHRGLFAAGESIDIDGPCGGFNLHWAWASGLVAGESAAFAVL